MRSDGERRLRLECSRQPELNQPQTLLCTCGCALSAVSRPVAAEVDAADLLNAPSSAEVIN